MKEQDYSNVQFQGVWKWYGRRLLNFRSGVLILGVILSIILTCYFTFLTLIWTGVRYNVTFQADYIEIVSPTSEPADIFKNLKTGDRIVAIDNIPVSQLLRNGGDSKNRFLVYPTQQGNDELSAAGEQIQFPYRQGQSVLLWSIQAKTLTIDTTHRNTGSAQPSNFGGKLNNFQIEKGVAPNSTNLITLNIDDLASTIEKDVLTIVLFGSAIFFCVMGLLFYVLQPSAITTVYSILNLLVSLELLVSSIDRSYLGTFEKVAVVLGGLIGPVFLHFMVLFPNGKALNRRTKLLLIVSYSLMISLLLLRLYTLLGPDEQIIFALEKIIRRLYRLGLLITCLTGLIILLYKFIRSKGRERIRIRLAVFAFGIAAVVPLLAVVYYTIVSLWQPVIYNNFGLFFLPSAIAPPIVGYAVLRNQLLGIKIRSFVLYLVLTLLVWATYVIISTLITFVLPIWREFSREPGIVALLLSILTALLYQLRHHIQTLIDRLFKVDPLDYNQLNQVWNARLVNTTQANKILEQVVYELPKDYHYKHAALLIWHPAVGEMLEITYPTSGGEISGLLVFSKEQSQLNNSFHNYVTIEKSLKSADNQTLQGLPIKNSFRLRQFFQQHRYILATDEKLPASIIRELSGLAFLEIEVVLPMKLGNELYGLLLMGQKAADYLPAVNELLHLNTLASQIAVSLHNSALIETEKVLQGIYVESLDKEERAREQERLKVVGFLHDDLLQQMFSMKRSLSRLLKECDKPASREKVTESLATVEKVIESLRDINSSLIPSHLKDDLLGTLKELFHENQIKHSEIVFDFAPLEGDQYLLEKLLDTDLKVSIYRLVEETLNNVVKHAQASRVTALIRLHQVIENPSEIEKYCLHLDIADDGVGFDLHKLQNFSQLLRQRHFGLSTIKRRVELYQGKIEFYSAPGKGLRIAVSLPLSLNSTKPMPDFDNLLKVRS